MPAAGCGRAMRSSTTDTGRSPVTLPAAARLHPQVPYPTAEDTWNCSRPVTKLSGDVLDDRGARRPQRPQQFAQHAELEQRRPQLRHRHQQRRRQRGCARRADPARHVHQSAPDRALPLHGRQFGRRGSPMDRARRARSRTPATTNPAATRRFPTHRNPPEMPAAPGAAPRRPPTPAPTTAARERPGRGAGSRMPWAASRTGAGCRPATSHRSECRRTPRTPRLRGQQVDPLTRRRRQPLDQRNQVQEQHQVGTQLRVLGPPVPRKFIAGNLIEYLDQLAPAHPCAQDVVQARLRYRQHDVGLGPDRQDNTRLISTIHSHSDCPSAWCSSTIALPNDGSSSSISRSHVPTFTRYASASSSRSTWLTPGQRLGVGPDTGGDVIGHPQEQRRAERRHRIRQVRSVNRHDRVEQWLGQPAVLTQQRSAEPLHVGRRDRHPQEPAAQCVAEPEHPLRVERVVGAKQPPLGARQISHRTCAGFRRGQREAFSTEHVAVPDQPSSTCGEPIDGDTAPSVTSWPLSHVRARRRCGPCRPG